MFLGDGKQKVMRKMLAFTAAAAVDVLWQFVNSPAHVHILLMDTIETIDKTVVYKAQKKRTVVLGHCCIGRNKSRASNHWECRGTSVTGT